VCRVLYAKVVDVILSEGFLVAATTVAATSCGDGCSSAVDSGDG